MLWNTHLQVASDDRRRMDLVAASGSRAAAAFHGMPLFCDITVCSPLSKQGRYRYSAHTTNGVTVSKAVDVKRRRYRDVLTSGSSALLVLGNETYRCWTEDTLELIKQLAYHKARDAPEILRNSARQGWSYRWWNMLSCGVMKASIQTILCKYGADLLQVPEENCAPVLTDVICY